jgi:hypothetical protein
MVISAINKECFDLVFQRALPWLNNLITLDLQDDVPWDEIVKGPSKVTLSNLKKANTALGNTLSVKGQKRANPFLSRKFSYVWIW